MYVTFVLLPRHLIHYFKTQLSGHFFKETIILRNILVTAIIQSTYETSQFVKR